MKKQEKEKIENHINIANIAKDVINNHILDIINNAKEETLKKYPFLNEEDFPKRFELTISTENGIKLSPIDNTIEDSYKSIEDSSLIGDDKLLNELSETNYEDIGRTLLLFIRTLDPEGKFKKSESVPNKFTNYHITENKIYTNNNWNFVSFTLLRDELKVNIYTGDYSPNFIPIFYEKPYPFFKIMDTFRIEDAKKLINESYLWKYKQITGI